VLTSIDKTPAHWSSINNGLYLCMECSGEHRGFGVNISYIRSITLDSLNKSQLDLLKIAGNKRLNDFLRFYSINKNVPRKQLYNSKIMHYYRKMIKAEANGEYFNGDVPEKGEMMDPYNFDFTTKNSNTDTGYSGTIPITSDHYSRSNTSGGHFISEDHYSKGSSSSYSSDNYNSGGGNNYNNNSSSLDNNYGSGGEKYINISQNYGNDSRYASISSGPIESPKNGETNSGSQNKGFMDYMGTVFNTTKDIASTLKDKAVEYELGSKLQETGSKTISVLKTTGSYVYEKSSEIAVRILKLYPSKATR
jgi:hypothetical protein